MGMPEKFSSGESHLNPRLAKALSSLNNARQSKRQESTLIVVKDNDPYGINSTNTLTDWIGSQYLFAIFPLTRLYLQHSIDSAITEILIDQVLRKGMQAYITTTSGEQAAIAALSPNHIISTNIKNISLNAYDLLFVRLLSVSGEIITNTTPNLTLRNSEGFSTQIEASTWKKSAYAPSLAYLLQTSLEQSLNTSLKDILNTYPTHKTNSVQSINELDIDTLGQTHSRQPSTIIIPPIKLQYAMNPEIQNTLTSSYGFSNIEPLSQGNVRRLIQRGIEFGIRKHHKSVIAAVGDELSPSESLPTACQITSNQALWCLEPTIDELLAEKINLHTQGIQLTMSFVLYEVSQQRTQIIMKQRCTTKLPLIKDVDGYWIVTLENAASIASEFFFARTLDARTLEDNHGSINCSNMGLY